MITPRRSGERGHANHGWLDSYHSFSFADYYDPNHMGFRSLRVINEDRVAPGGGFGTHPHRDMEIVTYVLEGSLEHKDSMGNGAVLSAGEVQGMTAGTGIQHSEFNPSRSESLHLFQVWILPAAKGLTPGYDQTIVPADWSGALQIIASPTGQDGVIRINQDVEMGVGRLKSGEQLAIKIAEGRYGWLQLASGEMTVNGLTLSAGDALALQDEKTIAIQALSQAEFLWFDLA